MAKRKTHCWRGHPFDEKNTQWSTQKRGRSTYIVQRCKRCDAEYSQRRYYADPVARQRKQDAAKLRYRRLTGKNDGQGHSFSG